ncbi:MAG: metallophosphoesterase [Victivallaceae bacterium]|nr:metallophosphoesterase [Victivallaceae bacterium]
MRRWFFVLWLLPLMVLAAKQEFIEPEFAAQWKVDGSDEAALRDPVTGHIELRKFLNDAPNSSKCLTVHGGFTASRDGEMVLGIGADWWFDARLNGYPVLSTMSCGNSEAPVVLSNQAIPVKVRKGWNDLDITVRSGDKGCSLSIGAIPGGVAALDAVDRRRLTACQMPSIPAVLEQPCVVRPGSTGVAIYFRTCGDIPSGIAYRRMGSEKWQETWDLLGGRVRTDRDRHVVELTGLEPGAEYEFKVLMADPDDYSVKEGGVYVFRTFGAASRPVRFFATGDTQHWADEVRRLVADFKSSGALDNCDFAVHLGDLDNYFNFRRLSEAVEPISHSAGGRRVVPWVQCRGNHEYRGEDTDGFFQTFSPDGRAYFSFVCGDTIFIVLDSGEDVERLERPGTGYTLNHCDLIMKEQRAWLEKLIASDEFRNAKFKVVLSHCPTEDAGGWPMAERMRKLTDDLFAGENPRARIHLWLAGHVHRYYRTIPGENSMLVLDPTTYTKLSGVYRPYTIAVSQGPWNCNPQLSGFVVDISGDDLNVKSVGPDGELLDAFTVHPDGTVDSRPGKRLLLKDAEIISERKQ